MATAPLLLPWHVITRRRGHQATLHLVLRGLTTTSPRHPHHHAAAVAPPCPQKKAGPDPFAWLEQPKDEVLAYLQAENRYTDKYLRSTHKVQHLLHNEMVERIGRENATLPEQYGPYLYYSRREKGKNFPIYYRRGLHDDKEMVVLDQNNLPDFYQHFQLGDYKMSPDHTRVAFTLCSVEQTSHGTLYIHEIATGRWWTCEREWERVCGFEWTRGGISILYTTPDQRGRPSQVQRMWLDPNKPGMKASSRVELLYQDDNDRFFVSVSRSTDHAFVMINTTSKTTSEVRVVDQGGEGAVKVVNKKEEGVQYFVEHGGGSFVMVVNSGPGGEYELFTAPAERVMAHHHQKNNSSVKGEEDSSKRRGKVGWEKVQFKEGEAALEDMDLFKEYCVLYERDTNMGTPRLRVLQHDQGGLGSRPWVVDWHVPLLPPQASSSKLEPGLNHLYDTNLVRFSLTSPIVPDVTYDYDMAKRRLTEVYREKIQGKPVVREEDYRCYTVSVNNDGVSVPLTLVHHTSLSPAQGRSSNHAPPVLLIGYGAYGVSLDLSYHPEYLPLLTRGWVLAFAHVRGGGERGRWWHGAGRGKDKPNSFHDYIACAKWLIQEGYTRPGRVVGMGGSAGGLLVGVAAMREPQLFGAVVLKVPFLDMANTMKDPTRPLTVHEYDEWGDATDPQVMDLLRSYSPYDNLTPQSSLPRTLVLSALMDDRVAYWEAAKWVAKARHVLGPQRSSQVLLRVDGDQGHFGPVTYTGLLEEAAFEQAFMMKALGEEATVMKTGQQRGKKSTAKKYMVPPPDLSFDPFRELGDKAKRPKKHHHRVEEDIKGK